MVETWEELLTATGNVEIKEGTVFDFNSLYPDRIPKIELPADSINANGAEFRNMYFHGTGNTDSYFYCNSIQNAKFLNFYIDNTDNYNSHAYFFRNAYKCSFSGMLQSGVMLAYPNFAYDRCSFNVRLNGGKLNGNVYSSSPVKKFTHCTFKFESNLSTLSDLDSHFYFLDCKFYKKLPFKLYCNGDYAPQPYGFINCVFDCELSEANKPDYESLKFKNCLANSEKVSSDFLYAGLERVTPDQMVDVEYLKANTNFPIV